MSTENNYSNVLAAVDGNEILAVIQGLPVDANGFFLTAEQMQAIDQALNDNETNYAATLASATELGTQVEALTADLAAANAANAAANEQLQAAQSRIAELEAMGAPAAATAKEADSFEPEKPIKTYATSWDKQLAAINN